MDSLLDYDQDLLAPPWGALGRDAVLGTVAAFSKLLLNVLNTTTTLNHSTYLDLVRNRPPGVGLLTVSNHTSTYDDPGLPCALLPLSFFWTEHIHHRNRWTMCAQDICFTNALFRQFFLNGKVLPVERGAGVDQSNVGVAARALGSGDWLHIFPEGRVVPSGHVGPFRQGIGKLICEARAAAGGRDPIILPYYHSGMSRVMPFKSSLPRVGHEVHVAVGQPLDLSHITCRCNQPGEDQPQVWRDLAVALRHAVCELQDSVPPNPNQAVERPDVAEYERQYQLRQQRAREQAKLGVVGRPEPVLNLNTPQQQQQGAQQQQQWGAHGSQQPQRGMAAGVAAAAGEQQGVVGVLRGLMPVQQQQQQQMGLGVMRSEHVGVTTTAHQGYEQRHQQQQEGEEGDVDARVWQQEQEQLLAVVRRVSRQQQIELEHIVDVSLHEDDHMQQQEQLQLQQQEQERQQVHEAGQQQGRQEPWQQRWQQRWQRGQELLKTWQQLQDRQVAMLLQQSKATAGHHHSSSSSSPMGSSSSLVGSSSADSSSSIVNSSNCGNTADSNGGSSSSNDSSSSSSWSWGITAWLPFATPAAATTRTGQSPEA